MQVTSDHQWEFKAEGRRLANDSHKAANDASLEAARMLSLAGATGEALQALGVDSDVLSGSSDDFASLRWCRDENAVLLAHILINDGRDAAALRVLRNSRLWSDGVTEADTSESTGRLSVAPARQLLLQEALLRSHPNVAVVERHPQGRVLVSRVDASPGTVMLIEEPLLVWDSPTNNTEPETPTAAFVRAFVNLRSDEERGTVLRMCCLDQTPEDAVALYRAVSRLRQKYAPEFDDLPTSTLVSLSIIERLNAHTYNDGNDDAAATRGGEEKKPRSALFDVMTKASHMCRPNCIYDSSRRAYVALRPIARGEEIGFPYFQRHALAQSASVRGTILRHSHQIPLCHCTRCAGDRRDGDPCRGLPCPTKRCGGTSTRRSRDHHQMTVDAHSDGAASSTPNMVPPSMWVCDRCGETWRDDEMPLAKEEKLSAKVHGLWSARHELVKGRFEEIKSLLESATETLGTRHWTYIFLLETAIGFFFAAARKSSGATADVARLCAAIFTHKFISTAIALRLDEVAPLLVTEVALSTARKLCDTAPQLRVDVVVLVLTGRALADVCAIFPVSVDAEWLRGQSEASTLFRHGAVDPRSAWQAVEGGDEVWRRINEDDADTLARWEDHLTSRVVGEMHGSRAPNLPASVRAALDGGRHTS